MLAPHRADDSYRGSAFPIDKDVRMPVPARPRALALAALSALALTSVAAPAAIAKKDKVEKTRSDKTATKGTGRKAH